jgi:hypothetical protein
MPMAIASLSSARSPSSMNQGVRDEGALRRRRAAHWNCQSTFFYGGESTLGHWELVGALEEKDGSDVIFDVQARVFTATRSCSRCGHRCSRRNSTGRRRRRMWIASLSMICMPSVFRALFHFIYTDSLPDVDCPSWP